MNTQKSILSFWKDIEVFHLPDLNSDAKLIDLSKPLPWELPFVSKQNSTWRHIVFFGKHSKAKIIEVIDKALGDNAEKPDWIEKPNGNTCMAVLILNEQGRLMGENPYLQASYLHGITCLQNGKNLSEVSRRLNDSQEKFRDRHPHNQDANNLEDASNPLIRATHLEKEVAVLNELNVNEIACSNHIYVHSMQVSKQARGDTAFLNSFYLDDLNLLAGSRSAFGKGLDSYLRLDVNQEARIDLLTEAEAFWQTIDPTKIPAGRWPSDPSYGLYSAQLGAVTTILDSLAHSGIIGVNGPPGTGKTTLLSDIVAEVVVSRAQKLIHANISMLFSKGNRIERANGFSYYYPVNSEVFDDAGIVVASNNNSAVENISKELPDEKKIDRNAFPDAKYFREYAQSLIEGNSWGLLAAALGNSENRAIFKNSFWYRNGDSPGFASFLQSLYNNPEEEDHTADYVDTYQKNKAELKAYLEQFNEFKKTASDFYSLLPGYLTDLKQKIEAFQLIEKCNEAIRIIGNDKKNLGRQLEGIQKRIVEIQDSIQIHQSVKPSFFFFQRLFKTSAFKKWYEPYLILINEHSAQAIKRSAIQKEIDTLNSSIGSKEDEKAKLHTKLKKIEERISTYCKKKENLHRTYGIALKNIPDENLLSAFKNDKSTFHKSNPWSSVIVNKLRSEIFIKSLQLHESVILRNAKQFKNNIGLLMEMMDGKADVSKDISLSLWQSFFFCIPVVSTSLASVGRLFGSLGRESIGWLLLDEAGQATPQSAAGIIYRAKRSVIIGDPLQIEPVVTTPSKLISVLNGQHKTEITWSPLVSSAQILADRITESGTWMKQAGNDESIWAGFPLRAHRRCNNPMFDLSNEIAYDNQMVKAMEDAPFNCILGPSEWFDIHGSDIRNKQVVEEEIIFLKEKIKMLGPVQNEVFVISPFKSVAERCKEDLRALDPKIQCGTIHTFQGKEADIVFLVLGSDPGKPGSRQWASQKPNMLNVALSRAKKRFYVIGSKKGWKGYNFFSKISEAL